MALIPCVKCGKNYSDTVATCPHCGYTPRLFVCSECGAVYMKADKTCKNCGIPLTHEKDIPAGAELIQAEYDNLCNEVENANTIEKLDALRIRFMAVGSFLDATQMIKTCEDKINAIKDAIKTAETYAAAEKALPGAKDMRSLTNLAGVYASLGEYKDAAQKASDCLQKAEALAKAKKKKGATTAIILAAVAVVAVFCVLLFTMIIPGSHYSNAEALFEQEEYVQAAEEFAAAGDYQDAAAKIEEAMRMDGLKAKYDAAAAKLAGGNFQEAANLFAEAEDYKDAKAKKQEASYAAGVECLDYSDYANAVVFFADAEGYADSREQLIACGKTLLTSGDYENAVVAYSAVDDEQYAIYAQGLDAIYTGDYLTAVDLFGQIDVEDSAERKAQANYKQAKSLLSSGGYQEAKAYFSAAGSYADAKDLLKACDLLEAEYYYDKGHLNTAKKLFEKLPKDMSYNGISVSQRLEKLTKFKKFVALCGKWRAQGKCTTKARQTHYSTGIWDEWTTTFNSPMDYIVVTCVINDNGTVTMSGTAEFMRDTKYSSLSRYLKQVSDTATFSYTGKKVPSKIKASSRETIKISKNTFTLKYDYTDRSESVNFKYRYRSTWKYTQLVEAY